MNSELFKPLFFKAPLVANETAFQTLTINKRFCGIADAGSYEKNRK